MPSSRWPSRWTLALILFALAYVALVLRYYYRVSNEPVTIIQCDVGNFHQGLLQERQPVVCKGVGRIPAVQHFFAEHRTEQRTAQDDANDGVWVADASSGAAAAMYDRLNAGKWYHRHEDPEVTMRAGAEAAAPSAPPRQSWYDLLMTIQHRGTRRVRLYAPAETPHLWRVGRGTGNRRLFCDSDSAAAEATGKARYTEIVLSEGDAVLLPMQWWIEEGAATKDEEVHSELAWRNPLSALHDVARGFL